MSPNAKSSRKEAAVESRAKLLQVGIGLLGQRLGSPFDNIRSTEVAREAGFTPGAFYHHWPSQDDYREDLRRQVGGQDEVTTSVDRFGANLLGGADEGIVHALRAAVRAEVDELVDDPSWHIQLAMQASHVQADLDCSGTQYEMWFEDYTGLYEQIFELLGVELRPEFSLSWFVRTMAALNEGYALQARSGIAATDDGIANGWQAYDLAVATLVVSVAQRIDGQPLTADTIAGKLEQLTA